MLHCTPKVSVGVLTGLLDPMESVTTANTTLQPALGTGSLVCVGEHFPNFKVNFKMPQQSLYLYLYLLDWIDS